MRKSIFSSIIPVVFSLVLILPSTIFADYVISGRVTDPNGAGVSGMTVYGMGVDSVLTDANGYYAAIARYGGSVTISCNCYPSFCQPAERALPTPVADVSGQDFLVSPAISISGRVTSTRGMPLASITIAPDNGGRAGSTDANGCFVAQVPWGWSGSLAPTLSYRTYEPMARNCVSVTGSVTGQDFVSPPVINVYAEPRLSSFLTVVRQSVAGEEIVLYPGTYKASTFGTLGFGGKAITIRSTNPQDPAIVAATIIDGENLRLCVAFGAEGRDSVLDGLTLRRGYSEDSYARTTAVYCAAASPTIRNCIIRDSIGTAVRSENGSPLISHCTFAGNGACLLALVGSNAVVENCTLTRNTGGCGVVNVFGTGAPQFTNCFIVENDFDYSFFRFWDGSTTTLRNCTIANNFCRDRSGIFGNFGGHLVITNSIVTALLPSGTPVFYNGGSGITVAYSNCPVPPAGAVWGPGNINVDPLFAVAGTDGGDGWMNNPGTTADESANNVYGDYHLKSAAGRFEPALGMWVKDSVTSPCIDAGDPSASWAGETWPNGSRLDMGAYGGTPQASFSPDPAMAAVDLSGDGIIDNRDLLILAEAWLSTASSPADLNADGAVNFLDYLRLASAYMLVQ